MIRIACVLSLIAGPVCAQGSAEEIALIRQVFSQLQPISIAEDREYCGYIGYDRGGALVASSAVAGEQGSCLPDDPRNIDVIVASYHTHGAYSPDYVNEVPSGNDVESDEAEGIDGYVATPGGRLWYIDTEALVISQLCGLGCLPADPQFVRGSDGRIELSYTYDELVQAIESEGG